MENNKTDFMKNRPVAASANQIKDVYGSQKSSTRLTVTAVLAAVDLIILIIGLITGNWFLTVVFGPLLIPTLFIYMTAVLHRKRGLVKS